MDNSNQFSHRLVKVKREGRGYEPKVLCKLARKASSICYSFFSPEPNDPDKIMWLIGSHFFFSIAIGDNSLLSLKYFSSSQVSPIG